MSKCLSVPCVCPGNLNPVWQKADFASNTEINQIMHMQVALAAIHT